MKTSFHTYRYLVGFVAGMVVTIGLFAGKGVLEFVFVGEPVVWQDSFPRYHTACISRFGWGEQAITFQIDNVWVFQTEDLAGGNLKERIVWESDARRITFHVDGLGDQTYDEQSKHRVED